MRLGVQAAWIPIVFLVQSLKLQNEEINIGQPGNLTIRGYSVNHAFIPIGDKTRYSVQICDFGNLTESVQFRWLQTSSFDADGTYRDVWSMDDVLVTYEPEVGPRIELLNDSFNNEELT